MSEKKDKEPEILQESAEKRHVRHSIKVVVITEYFV